MYRFQAALLVLLTFGYITMQKLEAQQESPSKYSIAIHGGAGGDPDKWTVEYRQMRLDSLSSVLDLGTKLLEEGGTAVDVVEQVVRTMEDDPIFNAGRGCVLNETGAHELDASIMDGETLRCGAVASVTIAKHPITLARRVMEQTRHVLLIGNGADEFAKSVGVELAGPSWFRTERKLESWQKWKDGEKDAMLHRPKNLPGTAESDELYLGTVGCVVLDGQGNLAAATSTGGLMGKRWGRVGDSPIIGAGNYADNRTCAVSGTGIGEEFIRLSVAKDIAARMLYGDQELMEAAEATVAQLPEDAGGVIAVDHHGNVAMPFNTPGMSRAFARSNGQRGVFLGREE